MNQTLESIRDRFSCRAFTGVMPDGEQLQAIARAATQAPSGMNRQPWQIIVARNPALIAELEAEGTRAMAAMPDKTLFDRIQSRGGRLFYNAPCVIFVPIDPAEPVGAAMDCGIVCQTIALAAQSLGLASCICGLAGLAFAGDKADYFKDRLAFPLGYEFGGAVLVGTANAAGTPHKPDPAKITYVD